MDQFRFTAAVAPLDERFISAAEALGLSSQESLKLATLLPQPLQSAPCFLDALTNLWRYEFGRPMDRLASGMMVWGTHMYHRIDHLVEVLSCAQLRLTSTQLTRFIDRLSDPAKHGNVLIEMLPVLRVHSKVPAEFEVIGYGSGNRTIDWLISPSDGSPVLIEVKHRQRDTVEYFDRLSARPRDVAPLAPEHDTDLLFQSLESKFLRRQPTGIVQGAWIHVSIKQEESELRTSFDKLDPERIHFVILGSWQEDVYLLARPDVDCKSLLALLGRTESDRFVFQRRHPPKIGAESGPTD
jgi:hypothetical protein